jgi:hypothetical protein
MEASGLNRHLQEILHISKVYTVATQFIAPVKELVVAVPSSFGPMALIERNNIATVTTRALAVLRK